MSKIIVSGLLNIETTLKIRSFPINYYPIDYPFFGVASSVSGVGMNVGKALNTLNDDVLLYALLANDEEGKRVYETLEKNGLDTKHIVYSLKETPATVCLYDETGRRQIYCDLKDWQEKSYEASMTEIEEANALVICNSNFNRELLEKAHQMKKLIITDVHVLSDLHDEYNQDFIDKSQVLFLSDEALAGRQLEFMESLAQTYSHKVIAMGCGKDGALLYVREENAYYHIASIDTRKVVNTVGAGDSLLSAFTHFYVKGYHPLEAMKLATLFASYKIGDKSASEGFLSEKELLNLSKEYSVFAERRK